MLLFQEPPVLLVASYSEQLLKWWISFSRPVDGEMVSKKGSDLREPEKVFRQVFSRNKALMATTAYRLLRDIDEQPGEPFLMYVPARERTVRCRRGVRRITAESAARKVVYPQRRIILFLSGRISQYTVGLLNVKKTVVAPAVMVRMVFLHAIAVSRPDLTIRSVTVHSKDAVIIIRHVFFPVSVL